MIVTVCALVGLVVFRCEAPTPPRPQVASARVCRTVSPVRYSRQDTAETRRQLRGLNARIRSACGDR